MTNIKDRIRYRRQNSVDPEAYLLDSDVIEPTEGDEDLQLTSEFEAALRAYVEEVEGEGVDDTDLATLFGVDLDDVEEQERPYPAYKIIHTIRNWPSEAALRFDIAVDRILRERREDWDDVPPRQRYRIAQSLRTFQDACLFCDGTVVYGDEPVVSCCGEKRVLTLHCEACERRFMEFTTENQNFADSVTA